MAKPLTDSDLVQVDQGFGGRLAVDEIRRLREANEGLRAKCAALERAREEVAVNDPTHPLTPPARYDAPLHDLTNPRVVRKLAAKLKPGRKK